MGAKGSNYMEDTICAIATSRMVGAISIIRVSGPKAISIVSKIFQGHDLKKVKSHTIHYGHIKVNDEIVDEVLVSVMLAPHTYTKEDVIEINSHGGINTTNKILEILLDKGCRLAEAGEFTKRAFLNGRLDLAEAESVNDLINAKTDMARKLALSNLSGNFSKEIKKVRQKITDIMANIEVNIDYPEYNDIEVVTNETLLPKLKEVKEEVCHLLNNSKNSKLIKEGIDVAIVGMPNVGKSSILNRLLNEDKAIVTDIAGTTRDIVEGSITLNGFLINFIDTAGIRETKDVVEKMGVIKSKQVIEDADLVIMVLSNNAKVSSYEQDLIKIIPQNKRIIFVNKSDLDKKIDLDLDYITGNTKEINGLDTLKEKIITLLNLNSIDSGDLTYASNVRQINLLKKAQNSLEEAIKNIFQNIPIDMIEIDVRKAWNNLGEIIGEVYEDELLDTLFSNFCVGK